MGCHVFAACLTEQGVKTLQVQKRAKILDLYYCPDSRGPTEADPGGVNPPQDCPADSEIWRQRAADRL